MEQYLLALITGLTTGGLSCLAVQGGLLATALERRVEKTVAAKPSALPILLFLAAKLLAYTALGFLLGALGSVFQLNPFTRAALLILIGVFMLGNALRMFNIHPIFRYFAIEPPKFITRGIRKTAKDDSWLTPVFLGALTVFIPCGVTQAMMAVAISSGDALQGGMLMFAFTLGTSPVFFVVSYLATKLGERAEAIFARVVAVIVLLVGLFSIDSGLNLMGLPSISRYVQAAAQPVAENAPEIDPSAPLSDTLTLEARNNGYFPVKLAALAGVPVKLNVVTDKTQSCSRAFVIPDLGVETILPETGTVPIDIPAQKAGYQMFFTCSMGMYTGVIEFK
jgi:sulfite exporter TauE/SafE